MMMRCEEILPAPAVGENGLERRVGITRGRLTLLAQLEFSASSLTGSGWRKVQELP